MESLSSFLGFPHLLPAFQMLAWEKRNLGTGQGSSVESSMILRQGNPQREHRPMLA